MARKKLEEPEKWITVNGQHLPVYAGGRIGAPGQEKPKKDTTSKNNGNHWKDVNNYRDRLNAAKTEEEREKVLDEMDEAWKRIDHDKSLSDVEKNQLQSHMRDTWSGKGKKTASMDLGNGLRLTADVSNPNKNISEVERAKKVNREKYTADKGLYQHRNAVKAEQEKAQAIANAISAKTGIANSGTKTTSRNAKYDTSRATKNSVNNMNLSELRAAAKKYGLSQKDISGRSEEQLRKMLASMFKK